MKHKVRCGFSLLELIVAMAILGFVVGLAGVAMPFARQHPASDPITMASNEAARTGGVVTRAVIRGQLRVQVAAYPDGRVIAETTLVREPAR